MNFYGAKLQKNPNICKKNAQKTGFLSILLCSYKSFFTIFVSVIKKKTNRKAKKV